VATFNRTAPNSHSSLSYWSPLPSYFESHVGFKQNATSLANLSSNHVVALFIVWSRTWQSFLQTCR
ncbi:unnamed protein product, partial [Arabidopsis halleri]